MMEEISINKIKKIIDINHSEFLLTEDKANSILNQFSGFLVDALTIEEDYKIAIAKPISEESVKEARNVRLSLKRLRTSAIKEIEKSKDEFYKPYKFTLQLAKTTEGFFSSREKRLLEVEKHFENLEKERLKKIEDERRKKLFSISESISIPIGVGTWEENVFESFYNSEKDRIEAEKKAEQERIEQERIEQEKRDIYQKRLNILAKYSDLVDLDIELTIETTQDEARVLKEKCEKLYNERQAEQERIAKEKAELEKKLEQERLEAEKKRLEAEKKAAAEKAKLEQERLEAEKKRLEAEKKAAAEKAKLEAEIAEQKQIEQERLEKERLEAEKKAAAEKAKLEQAKKLDKEKRIIEAKKEIEVVLKKYNLSFEDLVTK